MGGFGNRFVEDVRDAGDIVRLISDYVPLKQAGARFKGLCPFHEEKTPSFSVDPTRQLFYCFGCQTGGDVFKFVQLYEKVGFREAVEVLARRWGVPIPRSDREQRAADAAGRVRELNGIAHEFFRKQLRHESGTACRRYLEGRGISEDTIDRLALGFAPDSWDALSSHLAARRAREQEVVRAGLALNRKSGQGHYDRFRDRLIFPIRDVQGRTVAFGGRAIGDGEPKYLNSPETPAYVKGDHLYGLDLSRDAIRHEGFAIVVEGYMDLAALLQAGFENVVASLGTAFSANQARLLARYTERIVLSYDGDGAGAKATARSVDLLLDRGFDVRVVDLPGDGDPDDHIREHGASDYARLVRTAPEYLEFLALREARARDLSRTDEQVEALNELLPHLGRLASAIDRAAWADRLTDLLGIEDGLVMQELRDALRRGRTGIRQPARHRASVGPARPAESRLVHLLLHTQDACGELAEKLEPGDLEQARVRTIVERIMALSSEGRGVTYPSVLESLEADVDKALLTRIAFEEQPEDGPGVEECLASLRRRRLAAAGREETRALARMQKGERPAPETAEVDERLRRHYELAKRRDVLS